MKEKLHNLLDSILALSGTPYHRSTWHYGDLHSEAKAAFLEWAAAHADAVEIHYHSDGETFDINHRNNFETIATWYRSHTEIETRAV